MNPVDTDLTQVQFVPIAEVAGYTERGWQLVGTVAQQVVDADKEPRECAGNNNYRGNGPPPCECGETEVCYGGLLFTPKGSGLLLTEVYACIGLDEKSALAAKDDELEMAKDQLASDRETVKVLDAKNKELETLCKGHVADIVRRKEDEERAASQRIEMRRATTNMEKDLGTLREKLGTERFNEILGR